MLIYSLVPVLSASLTFISISHAYSQKKIEKKIIENKPVVINHM